VGLVTMLAAGYWVLTSEPVARRRPRVLRSSTYAQLTNCGVSESQEPPAPALHDRLLVLRPGVVDVCDDLGTAHPAEADIIRQRLEGWTRSVAGLLARERPDLLKLFTSDAPPVDGGHNFYSEVTVLQGRADHRLAMLDQIIEEL